jgi:hypothetical protein
VFGRFGEGLTPTPEDLQLAKAMGGLWSSFAASGVPSFGTVSWPRSELPADPYLDISAELDSRSGLSSPDCDFWDARTTW